ncbi:MAG: signal recognition particle-docking protein FtsY [Actinobacteria bacterium]|nr:signal recognition particle-docking protein FtsY [Actinomycetota bacterium]
MSESLAPIVLIGIFVLAAFLLVLPRIVRSREASRDGGATAAPSRPSTPPPLAEAAPAAATTEVPPELVEEIESIEVVEEAPPDEPPRLRDRIGKTRASFAGLLGVLRRGGKIDAAAWDELEEALLLADVGMTTTQSVVDGVKARAAAAGADADADALPDLLRAEITERLEATATDRSLHHAAEGPTVWLMVGVNGVGKTTTTAKIAKREIADGNKVLLAAADTFRAAAADQLAKWADRLGCALVRGQDGGDPGAVVFDAMDAATARRTDVVIVDTAGRLHTKVNLMRELEKLKRIVERTPGALQEVLLVLDASTGQNGLTQAREFAGAVDITGVVLTKLDGTAKGGVVLAIEDEFQVPVKLVGLGEGADDLVPFDPAEFAAALVE